MVGAGTARARVPLRSRPCGQPLDHPHQRRGSEELQAGRACRRRCRARPRCLARPCAGHNPHVFIENFKPFNSFVAIEERAGGNKHIRMLSNSGRSSDVVSDEPAYAMEIGDNREVSATKLRYTYDSLTTPEITYEVDAQYRCAHGAQAHARAQLRPVAICDRAGVGDGARRDENPRLAGLSQGLQARRHRGDAAIWLWQLRPLDGPGLFIDRPELPRPRHGLCDRAYPRRAGNGPRLV